MKRLLIASAFVLAALPALARPIHGGASATSDSPSRSVTGLIFQDDFTDVSAWTAGTGWAADTTLPTYIAYPSPRAIIPVGISTNAFTGSGPREGTPYIDPNTGRWYIFYDSGDGSASNGGGSWVPQLAYSDDRGLTLTYHGSLGLSNGIYAGRAISTGLFFDGGVWYIHILDASSYSAGIPEPPYLNSIFSFTDPLSTYTLVRDDSPTFTGTGFDSIENNVTSEELISGTYHAYYAASNGSTWAVGHATGPSAGGPFTKDGLGNYIASAVTADPENPQKWYDATLGKYVICNNAISGGSHAGANDCYYSVSQTSFQGSDVYRYRIQYQQAYEDSIGTFNAVGLITPFRQTSNIPYMLNGFMPFMFDSGAPTTFNGHDNTNGYHLGRSLYPGVLEPSLGAANFTGTSAANLIHTVSHGDFEAEFGLEIPNGSTSGTAGFLYRRSSTTGDGTNGYAVLLTFNTVNSFTITLYKVTANVFTSIGSGVTTAIFRDSDARNRIIARIRLSVQGSAHAVYVNGDPTAVATATDATYSSGGSVSFRGTNPIRFTHFSMRTANAVSVTGAGAGGTVVLRGVGGVVLATATADGSGNATISSTHFPAYEIDANSKAATGSIWGGDTWAF